MAFGGLKATVGGLLFRLPSYRKQTFRRLYDAAAAPDAGAVSALHFLNWGYADQTTTVLPDSEEDAHLARALYDHVATAAGSLRGRSVLEVGQPAKATAFRRFLQDAGLRSVQEENISERVRHARELVGPAIRRMADQHPRNQDMLLNWAAVPGTPNYDALASGRLQYLLFVAHRKP